MVEGTSEEINKADSPSTKAEPVIIEPKANKFRSRNLWIAVSVAAGAVILVFGAFYVGTHFKQTSDEQKIQGTVSLSETELRNLVRAQNLTAYWVGPVAGDTYTLYVPKTGTAVVRYLTPGSSIADTSPTYRLVATYILKDAFTITSLAATQPANLGFINIDGNAVYYVKTRPTNVFVGIKDKDVQLEIFDPGQGQAVALALFKGQVRQIS